MRYLTTAAVSAILFVGYSNSPAADGAADAAFVDLIEARKLELTPTMIDLLDVLKGE